MAYITTIDAPDATSELATLYKKYANPDGSVDDVLRVHALNPASLEAHCTLYVQSMHRPSPLSRAEREMVGVVVSRLNGCSYCLTHHAQGLRRLLPADRQPVADALEQGKPADLTERESAMIAYTSKLTRTPSSIAQTDVDALRAAGLTDREVLDLAQAAGYFAYANRIVLGLGAAIEDDGPLGAWPRDATG